MNQFYLKQIKNDPLKNFKQMAVRQLSSSKVGGQSYCTLPIAKLSPLTLSSGSILFVYLFLLARKLVRDYLFLLSMY